MVHLCFFFCVTEKWHIQFNSFRKGVTAWLECTNGTKIIIRFFSVAPQKYCKSSNFAWEITFWALSSVIGGHFLIPKKANTILRMLDWLDLCIWNEFYSIFSLISIIRSFILFLKIHSTCIVGISKIIDIHKFKLNFHNFV